MKQRNVTTHTMKPNNCNQFPIASILLLLILGINSIHALIDEETLEKHFQTFKIEYGRQYGDSFDENYRKSIFATNLEFIIQHNIQNGDRFRVSINNFTDMTNQEFRKLYFGYRPNVIDRSNLKISVQKEEEEEKKQIAFLADLPDSVDWTKKNAVTPVKSQGQCGSAYAFSVVASIEGAHAISTGNLVSLSEQNIADCAKGSHGCSGGFIDNGFQYVIDNHGIDTEAGYPKTGDGTCHFNRRTVGATISSYVNITAGSESRLQAAVANAGPVSVGVDASQASFQFYSSGVYDEPSCSQNLDHAMAVVGYGTFNGKQFWKVKNSWGISWGQSGYILMSRNQNNQCGIATAASYPVV